MRFLFALTIVSQALSLTLAQSSQRDLHLEKWNLFMNEYNKVYRDETEKTFRFNAFLNNLYIIDNHNKLYEKGEETYELGLNEHADLLYAEFLMKKTGVLGGMLGTNSPKDEVLLDAFITPSGKSKLDEALEACPTSVNWTATTPKVLPDIKDQRNCGSSWAFSAATTLEARNAVKTGNLISVSEQNLLDCTYRAPYNNNGCNGGWMVPAFEYIRNNSGISTDAAYVYSAQTGTCKYNEANKADLVVSDIVEVKEGSEAALQVAVCTGPVAVGINAAPISFQFYKSGVYNDKRCVANKLNHAVVAVGYGTVGGKPVWIIANSWGETWGWGGYAYVARNENNMCGIASKASYPIIGPHKLVK